MRTIRVLFLLTLAAIMCSCDTGGTVIIEPYPTGAGGCGGSGGGASAGGAGGSSGGPVAACTKIDPAECDGGVTDGG